MRAASVRTDATRRTPDSSGPSPVSPMASFSESDRSTARKPTRITLGRRRRERGWDPCPGSSPLRRCSGSREEVKPAASPVPSPCGEPARRFARPNHLADRGSLVQRHRRGRSEPRPSTPSRDPRGGRSRPRGPRWGNLAQIMPPAASLGVPPRRHRGRIGRRPAPRVRSSRRRGPREDSVRS